CLVTFFGAPIFLSTQPDAVLALRILSPTIVFSGLLGCLRGYFQAQNSMFPTAVSRVVEQIVNAVVSVLAAWLFTRSFANGEEMLVAKFGAAGGTLGTGAGVLAGILFMLFVALVNMKLLSRRVLRDRHRKEESYREVFRIIFLMVTPIIFSTFIYNSTAIVDQNIYNYFMLWRGVPSAEASSQYGIFSYQFKPIINIPIAMSSATSTALIPAVAAAMAGGKREDAIARIDECMKLSSFLAIPAAVGLAVLSTPVIRILYPSANADAAGLLLSIGAVSVVFYSFSTVTNGVLQGLGHPSAPMKNAAIALLVNAVVAVVLVGFTPLGILGVLIATVVYAAAVTFLNGFSMRRYLKYRHDLRRLILAPLSAALVMGLVCGGIYWLPTVLFPGVFGRYLPSALLTAIAVIAGIFTYVILYTKATGMTDEEMRKLPMGTKLLSLLRRLRIR
ncbi:MAG: lipid II flippase MurJ, partial [Lachnospiraceae bacterium]